MNENQTQHEQVTDLQPVQIKPGVLNLFDPAQYEVAKKVCIAFSNSDLVPETFRKDGKGNTEAKAIANCLIAIELASRLNASPLMVMQNLYIVQGRPSWSSKFLIGTINSNGKYEPLNYRIVNKGKIGVIPVTEYHKVWTTNNQTGKGYYKTEKVVKNFDGREIDNIECVAYTRKKGGEEELVSSPASILMAIQEGWYQKENSKWQTMPTKMLRYRAASFWANEFAPELSMGIYTQEECEDIAANEVKTIDTDYEEVKPKTKLGFEEAAPAPSTPAPAPQPAQPAQAAPQARKEPEMPPQQSAPTTPPRQTQPESKPADLDDVGF